MNYFYGPLLSFLEFDTQILFIHFVSSLDILLNISSNMSVDISVSRRWQNCSFGLNYTFNINFSSAFWWRLPELADERMKVGKTGEKSRLETEKNSDDEWLSHMLRVTERLAHCTVLFCVWKRVHTSVNVTLMTCVYCSTASSLSPWQPLCWW